MKLNIQILIFLLCISSQYAASTATSQLYGDVLDPYQLQVFEEKDITVDMSSIDFPAIKTLIGQKDQTPVLCTIQNSLPDVEESSALVLPTDKTVTQIATINNFTYVIYNDISIDILQPAWNAQKNVIELVNATSISSPLELSETFNHTELIYSWGNDTFQVWTNDRIFMFDWDSYQGALSFVKSENIPAGMKGVNSWIKHQVLNDYVYLLYKESPNKIVLTNIETSYVDTLPTSTEILLTDSTSNITDFYAASDYVYVAQKDVGVHIYQYSTSLASWNRTNVVNQAGIKAVTGNNRMFVTVNPSQGEQFQVTEYVINTSDSNTFQENSKRIFSRQFTGEIQVDDTKAMLLNQNVMFIWYHSVPTTVQQKPEKLINSFVFYGETSFNLDSYSTSGPFLYSNSGDQIKMYQLSDQPPELYCPITSLQSVQVSKIHYNLEFIGVTCPIKTELQDYSPENICIYRQELVIDMSGAAFNGIKWGWVVLIGFGFSILFIGLGFAIYYIRKNRRANQYARDRLYLLKEDKPRIPLSNRSFINDVSSVGESFAPFRHDRTEIKDDISFTRANILPTRMDETMKSGLSNSPNKIDLEDADSPVRDNKYSNNQVDDDYKNTAKTASINLDIMQ